MAGLGGDDQGPDADDPALTLDVWRERIRRHPGELKNLLRNQAFVAGIGNAYSDEILHAAKLLPFRKRSSLAAEEVDALYAATRTTLATAIDVLRERVPPTFEKQVRDFLAVHDKGGQAVPALRDAGSPRSAPAGSSRRTAAAASAEARRGASSAQLQDLADVQLRRIGDVVQRRELLDRRPEGRRDPAQGVAPLHGVALGRSRLVGLGLTSVGTRVGLGAAVFCGAGSPARSASGSRCVAAAVRRTRGGRRRPRHDDHRRATTPAGREPRHQDGHERDREQGDERRLPDRRGAAHGGDGDSERLWSRTTGRRARDRAPGRRLAVARERASVAAT